MTTIKRVERPYLTAAEVKKLTVVDQQMLYEIYTRRVREEMDMCINRPHLAARPDDNDELMGDVFELDFEPDVAKATVDAIEDDLKLCGHSATIIHMPGKEEGAPSYWHMTVHINTK